MSLETSGEQLLPLRRELEFVESYLAIEHARFGDRLRFELDISPETHGALVPAFLLQPLVENAVRHGLEPRAGAGVLVVRAHRSGPALQLSVSDNGIGLADDQPMREGIGLSNTRARLHALFDGAATLELRRGDGVDGQRPAPLPYVGMKVIIVDDEPLARERLRRLLSGEPDVEIVAECADGPSAVEAVRRHRPDLLLLDVQMPGMDGFETLRALDAKALPTVVFVTGFDQHAVHAFEARALDYLLKPTTRARLAESLTRVRERLADGVASPQLPQALLDLLAKRAGTPLPTRVRRLVVRTGERVIFVPTEDVSWVEAAGNYAVLHVGSGTHILRETMSSLEGQLSGEGFLRVSRSAIVNLRRVKELQSIAPGEQIAILVDGQRVPMTRGIREVEEQLRSL